MTKLKRALRANKKETAKEPPAHQSQSSNLDASKGQARENHDPLEDSTPKFKDGLYLQAVRMLPYSITFTLVRCELKQVVRHKK